MSGGKIRAVSSALTKLVAAPFMTDRVGAALVRFNSGVYPDIHFKSLFKCRDDLNRAIARLPDRIEGSTSLYKAIAQACGMCKKQVEFCHEQEAKRAGSYKMYEHRPVATYIFLLTDGEDTSGDPLSVASSALSTLDPTFSRVHFLYVGGGTGHPALTELAKPLPFASVSQCSASSDAIFEHIDVVVQAEVKQFVRMHVEGTASAVSGGGGAATAGVAVGRSRVETSKGTASAASVTAVAAAVTA